MYWGVPSATCLHAKSGQFYSTWNIWEELQLFVFWHSQIRSSKPMFMDLSLGEKNNTSCHTVLTVLAVKTQISHKKKVEGELVRSGLLQLQLVWSLWGIVTVRWNPDWIFSITTALSKAAKAKTPRQPAGSPSKLFVRESVMRNISTKRALTYFVSEANWTIYMQRLVVQVAGFTVCTTRSKTFLSGCVPSAWVVLHWH